MPEDRQTVLDAGLDDYLVKPIDPKALGAVLARWSHATSASALAKVATIPASTTAADEPRPVLDAGTVAQLVALETQQPGFVSELLAALEAQMPADVRALRDAATAGDVDVARAAAHRLKGACLSVGALRMAGLCEAIERELKGPRAPAAIDAMIATLTREHDDTKHALASAFATARSPARRSEETP
jgi:HPt (histidine-containing phosphotransfer) domain-containing protein